MISDFYPVGPHNWMAGFVKEPASLTSFSVVQIWALPAFVNERVIIRRLIITRGVPGVVNIGLETSPLDDLDGVFSRLDVNNGPMSAGVELRSMARATGVGPDWAVEVGPGPLVLDWPFRFGGDLFAGGGGLTLAPDQVNVSISIAAVWTQLTFNMAL
jgi:hypothetical protein